MRWKRLNPPIFGLIATAVVIGSALPQLAQTASQKSEWKNLTNGADIYAAACATCHSTDGAGNNQSTVAFETELPDFSDCNFTSREPAADWYQIARIGGPVRGFDQMMPAFGEALRPEQIEAAVAHVKGFCNEDKWPDGAFNLPKALVTGKAYPEDEYLYLFTLKPGVNDSPVEIGGKFVTEKRVGARHQFELAIPFTVKQRELERPDGTTKKVWGEGIGDIALGYKVAVFHSLRAGTILSLSTEILLPTGDEYDEIGKGFFRFEPFLAMAQIIPHVGFLQVQAGAELSTRPERAAHEMFWRGAFGRSFSKDGHGRTWSPMIEILGAKELESGTDVEWQLVPEMQVTLNQRQHIMFCAGAKIPLTDFDSSNIQYMAYLLWDWFDGGFTDGW